jgi:hypothetical protein
MQLDIASVILIGHQLTASDVQMLERKLAEFPDDFEDRLKLIGYYYKHYYCCEPSGRRRMEHIIWLIRKNPDFKPILSSYLHTHLLDRQAYACIKAAWQAALNRSGTNMAVYCNMASFVQFSEPELAAELYEKALQFTPGNPLVTSRLQKLQHTMDLLIENRDAILKSHDSYYLAGAVPCPDKKAESNTKAGHIP